MPTSSYSATDANMTMTGFEPERDGFAFVNSWTYDDTERGVIKGLAERAARDALRVIAPIGGAALDALGLDEKVGSLATQALPDAYGLCGGMAFAALDYYKSGIEIPRGAGRDDIPTRDTPEGAAIRSYLWARLIDSLETNLPTFLAWMAMLHLVPSAWPLNGGAGWLRDESRKQWASLKKHVDSGEPWPIGLIGSTREAFNNHQVLACGYSQEGSKGIVDVYDMNCPGVTNTIRINLDGESLAISGAESCGSRARGTLRGFFCEKYAPKVPEAKAVL